LQARVKATPSQSLTVGTAVKLVADTRWWPPFCLVVDWVCATVIAIAILAGVNFH
jgi:hypothetical protein